MGSLLLNYGCKVTGSVSSIPFTSASYASEWVQVFKCPNLSLQLVLSVSGSGTLPAGPLPVLTASVQFSNDRLLSGGDTQNFVTDDQLFTTFSGSNQSEIDTSTNAQAIANYPHSRLVERPDPVNAQWARVRVVSQNLNASGTMAINLFGRE